VTAGATDSLRSAARKRWWVLITYTIFAGMQALTWAVPGIIPINMGKVNGISDSMIQIIIQLLVNYGCICFVLFSVPCMWSIDRHGARLP